MKKLLFTLCALCLSLCMAKAESVTVVSSGSSWKYFKGTQEPSTATGEWRNASFSDSSWLAGDAPLYYGGSISAGTLLSDMKGGYSTLYMRKTVSLSSGTYSNLSLNVLCDDGFILWINGTEVMRYNAYTGEQSYSALSSGTVGTASWITYDLSEYSDALNAGGDNILAIQAFNITLDRSSDFAMDMELTAECTNDLTPPTVSSISPTAGLEISDPPAVLVLFSESVSGVSANSLLCEGEAAESFQEISSRQYLFKFAERGSDGTVSVAWNSSAEITDQSDNKNAFVVPTESWSYTVNTALSSSDVIISEILASNNTGLETESGDRCDWIELYNQGSLLTDISGWYLTDSSANLTQWQFPSGTVIPSNGYLVVFCNGTDEPLVNREYFANFNLSRKGEYLALVKADGVTIAYEFTPAFPAQYPDISYGLGYYYSTPTPGAENATGYDEPVGEVTFSEPRGYKDAAFELTLSSATEGATIYYTLDGSIPTTSSTLYSKPISISTITCLRAFAVKSGHIDSQVTTRTWLFLEEAVNQDSSTPDGWPDSYAVNRHRMVYGMNPDVVNDASYSEGVREGMTNICTISMVTDLDNLFDSSIGIYVNPSGHGIEWERPASLELIDPSGGDEFQINAGIRIRGGFSRSSSNPKHSFRFFFRDEYGGKLEFPLFGSEGASVFSKVDLRTSQNYAWSYLAGNPPEYNTFIRETFARDSQRDVGMPYTRSRYYQLFINGQYWGLYQTQERSEADFAETYLGGDDDDWDCIKSGAEAADGNATGFTKLYNIAMKEGFSGVYATNYNRIKGLNEDGSVNPDLPQYLDEDNLIQFVLNVFYTSDIDSPIGLGGNSPNNLYGLYNHTDPSGFTWYRHDAEHSMGAKREYGVSFDMTSRGWNMTSLQAFTPIQLHQKLMDHPDYKMRFEDLMQQTYVAKTGSMCISSNLFRWNSRQQEIDKAIYTESARWTIDCDMRYEDWLMECDWVKDSFISLRLPYMINELTDRGWYPTIEMPTFSQDGGTVLPLTAIQIVGEGTVYYTTDGSDPRSPGGAVSESASQLEPVYSEERVLLSKESSWDYYDLGDTPAREGSVYWYQPKHTHSGWKQGTGRFGFGSKAVNTQISQYIDGTTNPLITGYFSTRFNVTSALCIPELTILLNCDDGAVVYLNGNRIINYNMPSEYLTADLLASSDIDGDAEDEDNTFQIDSSYLVEGENTISVEVHQSSATSDDLYFDLEISAVGGYSGNASSGLIIVSPGSIIKARSLSDSGEWSTIATADFTVYSDYSDFKVTEMMYAAQTPDYAFEQGWSRDDFAWIELQNTGDGLLNLEGIKFVSGIDYTFPALKLNSGEYVVLAKNITAFTSYYDTNGIILLGDYSGKLARKGETVTLQTPQGDNIINYTYSNTWYPATDKGGYSLVVADTEVEESLWSTADNWKQSTTLGGSPGTDDGTIIEAPIVGEITPGTDGKYVAQGGESLSLAVSATGSRPLRYQWYKDGEAISGATFATYSIQSCKPVHAGIYTVTVTNKAGTVTSNPLELTVDFVLTLSSISINGASNVIEGQTASYTCIAIYNDDTRVAVQPTWSVDLTQYATVDATGLLTAIAEGFVNLTASYSEGDESKTITIPVTIESSIIAPSIITQPVGKTVGVGESVSFSVVVMGSEPMTYQWYKNAVAIQGATASTYQLSSVTTDDAGSYYVTVTNTKGSATSSACVLKVISGTGSELILDFQLNEGENSTTVDSVNNISGTLIGLDSSSSTISNISTNSPSQASGDYAAVLGSSTWLSGWFETAPLDLTEPFTWEAWVWMNESGRSFRDFMRIGNTLKFGMDRNGHVEATLLSIVDVDSTFTLNAQTWTHIACTWDPGVGFNFYKNGTLAATSSVTSYPVDYVNSIITIGADNGGSSIFTGMMDRVRLHRTIFAASELDSDADNPKAITDDTVLAFDFDETTLPFSSKGDLALSLYNGTGDTSPSTDGIAWASSTPARDYVWTGSENDYSLQLKNTNSTATGKVTFEPEALAFDDQTDQSFSVEAWVKGYAAKPDKQVIMQIQGGQSGNVPRIALAISSNLTVYITTLGVLDIDTLAPIPSDNNWHHIACVYSYEDSVIYVYVDGVLTTEVSYDRGVSFSSSTGNIRACIGCECSGVFPYSGYVDRIRLHKGVLSPSDLDYFDYSSTPATAPTITAQPESQSFYIGDEITLSVTATGTEPLTYQWYKNNVIIEDATSATYHIANLAADDAGSYTVYVSNEAGTVISSAAVLEVATPILRVIANDVTRIYGTANPELTYVILNELDEDVSSTISGTPTLSTTALLGSKVGTYPIVALKGSLSSANTYEFVKGTFTILKATPEIVWAAPSAISYGTALSTEQLNATANVDGTFVYDPLAGTVLESGTHTLTVTFTPTDTTNYETVSESVEISVEEATMRVIANDVTRIYGTANPELTYVILNELDEDVSSTISGTPTLSTTALLGSKVGTYPIVVLKGSLSSANKYVFVKGTFTILKATPEIMWAVPSAIFYGTALSTEQLNATANVDGTFVYDPLAGTVLESGTHTLTVTFTPTDTTNYETVSESVEISVEEATIDPTLSYTIENGDLVLHFTGFLYESDDLITWKLVSGAEEKYTINLNDISDKKQQYYRSANK